jgi:hypothetical protein
LGGCASLERLANGAVLAHADPVAVAANTEANHAQLIRLRRIAERIIPFTNEWNPRAKQWKWDRRADAHRMQGLDTPIPLAAQDTAENALAELSVTGIRLKAMVFHGDTLYAYTEVLDKRDADRPDAGVVVFRHLGFNQKDEQVFEGQRTVLIRRRPAGLQA